MTSRAAFVGGLLACSVALAVPAFAAPPNAETAAQKRSRTLFEDGRALADKGNWDEACPLFRAAHELNATGGTALQLANCYEHTGKLAQALELYESILAKRDTERVPDRLRIAEEHAAALRKQLEAAKQPAPAPSAAPAPAPSPASAAPSASAPPSGSAPLAPSPDRGALAPSHAPAYVAFTVGGVGIGVGAIFGALALSQAGSVRDRCPNDTCPSSDRTAIEDDKAAARTKAWVSNIGLAVGVVGVATGIVLLLAGGKSRTTAQRGGPPVRSIR